MHTKYYILAYVVLSSLEFHSQERFNVRNPVELESAIFKGVVELSDGYGVSFNGVLETDTGNIVPMGFAKFSSSGVYLMKKMYFLDQGYSIIISSGGMNWLNSDLEYVSIGQEQATGLNKGFLASFNENGDTLDYIQYFSPYLEEFGSSFMGPVGICSSLNEDNSIFISSNILQPESGSSGGDFYIQRMTPEGEVLWEYIYATDAQPEYCNALLPTENGGVLGLVSAASTTVHLLIIDSTGEIDTIIDTEVISRVNDVLWSSDETFIATGLGIGTDGIVTGKIFNISSEGELLWDTIIGDGYAQSFQNQFYKIVKSQDNTGYVAGGVKKEFLPDSLQTDSTGNTISQGWLVKVNEEGQVLWDRTYHYINTPNEEHTLNDLKATSDGGYIFCGESTDNAWSEGFSEGPQQQGWLVKVDEYGCLVEGCHLMDSIPSDTLPSDTMNVIEEIQPFKYFKAGPIPAGDFLNVYQNINAHTGSKYQLINSNGQVVEEFPASNRGTTMMLDVSTYASGQYQLVLRKENEVLQMEKIIIQ